MIDANLTKEKYKQKRKEKTGNYFTNLFIIYCFD